MDNKQRIAEIAHLYYIENLTQQKIADIYNVDRSSISRAIKYARENGIVEISIPILDNHVFDLKMNLKNKYKLNFIEISKNDKDSAFNDKLFYSLASESVRSNITSGQNVGVSWGVSISKTIDYIKPKSSEGVTFVPIAGAPSSFYMEHHINTLIYKLSHLFGGEGIFINAPTVLEDKYTARKILESNQFSALSDAWGELDVCVLGVGGRLSSTKSIWRSFLTEKDYDLLRTNEAVGDIAARFFSKEGRFIKGDLDDRTIAISEDDLLKVPERIAIARGEEKVSAIRTLLENNLITGLITDSKTAERLV